jgi:hypothetical protein
MPPTRTTAAVDPKPTSDLRLVDLFMAGRMRLDRLIARYDFADFNIPPLMPSRAV